MIFIVAGAFVQPMRQGFRDGGGRHENSGFDSLL